MPPPDVAPVSGQATENDRRATVRGSFSIRRRERDGATLSTSELERFATQLAARTELWRHLVCHNSTARMYERICDDDYVNAWLICWSPDHDTGFHDHDDSAAAITVIEGQVREERLRLGAAPSTRLLEAGMTVAVPATAIHRVVHAGSTSAVTIHAYSPPLHRTGAYRLGAQGELERVAQPYEQELRAA